MINKYKFTEETIEYDGHILHRIQALKKIGNVKKGDLGGWIEKEKNLSQEGKCWIFDNAKVYGNAFVWSNVCIYDDAIVCDDTQVFGDVGIYKKAKIYGNSLVYGKIYISDNAEIYGYAEVNGNSIIRDNAKIYDNACICGNSIIRDNAKIYDNAQVCGNTNVYGNAKIYGEARIYDKCMIRDSAKVYGNAIVSGNAEITGNAEVNSIKDYLVFKNNWSSGRYFTWTLSNNMWRVGCFYGTGKQLIEKAYKDSNDSGIMYERYVNLVENKNFIKDKNYELTDETIEYKGHVLHRIKALNSFGMLSRIVYEGQLGGWIESEDNLGQSEGCWVGDEAKVYGNAHVHERAFINGNAEISGDAIILGDVDICENAKVYDNAQIVDNVRVFGNAKIHGNACLCGNAEITGNAEIESEKDYIAFKNNWSSGFFLTWTKSNNMWYYRFFHGTGKELIEKAYNDSEESGKMYEKYVKFVEDLNK